MDFLIETEHGAVPASLAGEGGTGVLLAHGAGAPMGHPWMVGMRGRLIDRGFAVMTFNYAYTAQGRKAPDRLPKLLDVHEAVAREFTQQVNHLVLAGKSMGGRVGGHLAAERDLDVIGVVYFGYPLVAMGQTDARPTPHLESLSTPQLFISGDRDRLGPLDLIEALADRVPNGSLVVIEGGDHSFVPLKRTGRTVEDSLDKSADATARWVASLGG